MARVVVSIQASENVKRVSVHIDGIDVTRKTRPVELPDGNHILHWWFAGLAGDKLDLAILPAGGGAALITQSDTIQAGYLVSAGDEPFTS